MAAAVRYLASHSSKLLSVMPNAGLPRLIEDKTIFDMEAEPFADGIAECLRAGARLVGGCCGTTPDHIRAVRRRLEKL